MKGSAGKLVRQKLIAFQSMKKSLPKRLGNVAKKHFFQSFADGGFTDAGLEKWKPRKIQRYKQGKSVRKKKSSRLVLTAAGKSDKGRGILIKTGDLRRSIKILDLKKNRVAVGSDLVYAKVHNEGLRAGRSPGFNMPVRRFVGESIALNRKIKEEIHKQVKKVFE
jgi:phage gpG-like protein